MRVPSAWRLRWWSWVVPLVLCIASAGFLWFNVASSANGFRLLERQVESQERSLSELTERRIRLEQIVTTARQNQEGLSELYDRRLASQSERLTRVIQEVKGLASRSGIEPPRISYRERQIDDFGVIQESLLFGVTGTYGQIRQLINLLEVSEDFLILEEIDLREAGSSQLDIDLSLSTLFADPSAAAPYRGSS